MLLSDYSRTVRSGHKVSLHSFVDGASGATSFAWSQIAGPKVTFDAADAADVSFTAPQVGAGAGERVDLRLRVEDESGVVESRKLSLLVEPADNVIVRALASDRRVAVGHTIFLHAQGTGATTPAWSWTQLEPLTATVSLDGADTKNPSFTVPDAPGARLRFQVSYTDTDTGNVSRDTLELFVEAAADALTGAPLTVGTASSSVPPQALALVAPPDTRAYTGASFQLAMTVVGGTAPYSWSWQQTAGTTAALSNGDSGLVTVDTSGLTSAETLAFEATVTDADGTIRKGLARAQVFPKPTQGPSPTAVVVTPQATLHAVSETPLTFTTTVLGASAGSSPTVTQTAGSQGTIGTSTTGGVTTVTFTPPAISADAETAELTVTGKDVDGDELVWVYPVRVLRPPGVSAPATPPQTVAIVTPPQLPPLTVESCGAEQATEGQQNVALGACAKGGTGSYSYSWTYERGASAPAVTLSSTTVSHPTLTAPGVDQSLPLRFSVTVDDGNGTASTNVVLRVSDLSGSVTVASVREVTVASGDQASLSSPVPTGGVPPYSYSYSQSEGPDVGPLTGQNPTFTAPDVTGPQPTFLTFTCTITDAVGNQVAVTESVVVLPAAPPLAVTLRGPSSALSDATVALGAHVAGGTPPYSFAYTASGATVTIPGNDNPQFALPSVAAADDPLDLVVKVTVTDDTGAVVESSDLTIQVAPAVAPAATAAEAERSLAAVVGQVSDVADLYAKLETIISGVPADQLTDSVPRELSAATQQALGASCPINLPNGRCVDTYGGDCASEFMSFLRGPGAQCVIVQVCAKSAGTCNGVTPEIARLMAEADRKIKQWFADNPGCFRYQDLTSCN